jgi:hypothetical protein
MIITRTHLLTAAAFIAGLALILSTFAPIASAQTIYTTSSAVFNRNLTIGSTGADVTALQAWLIAKGHTIPAGATGYFGPQTRAALAAYQSASGIAPAYGFFGPITRGRINPNVTPGPAMPVPPSNNDDDEDEDDELEVEVEFRNGRAYIEINEDGDEDTFNIRTTSRSRVVEEVAERLDMDEEDIEDIIEYVTDDDDEDDELEVEVEFRNDRAYVEINEDGDEDTFTLNTTSRTRVIEEVAERLDMDEDDIEDIIEFTTDDDDEDEDEDNDVRSSAQAVDVDGADNDYAVFRMTFDVEAFGEDIFVPRDAEDAFTYRIENASTGATVSGETTLSAAVSSSADTEGSSYLIREEGEEEFTVTVNFNPLPGDEGQTYRLQLLTLNYDDEEGGMSESSTLRPEGEFESESVFIAD